MTLEEKVFERKRFIFEKLVKYGFQKKAEGYLYETDFMKGDFHVVITVSQKGMITGKVIDVMNEEEYNQLHMENLNGAYIGSVRKEYEKLLNEIADACCTTVLFAFDQANRITEMILEKYDVRPDFPWEQTQYQSYGTFRHVDSGKWFALIMNIKWDALLKDKNKNTVDVLNLKINSQESENLTAIKGIYLGYHMNHKNWISVVLNETLSDNEVLKLIDNSFSLTGLNN
ncbi:hypothetical protein HMPREF1987_01702 [Peptostreptococcaceae bacterium oral taxon 113 str. W5053]|nr:hypothetical protein HMPREF1987_01702 [Peptostreptococcaceae bacterium oral taxon 113 str. W5053]